MLIRQLCCISAALIKQTPKGGGGRGCVCSVAWTRGFHSHQTLVVFGGWKGPAIVRAVTRRTEHTGLTSTDRVNHLWVDGLRDDAPVVGDVLHHLAQSRPFHLLPF